MKITKKRSVKACVEPHHCNECCCASKKQEAIDYIKKAMECLASDAQTDVCKESIANLSVVLVDLSSDEAEMQDALVGVDADPEGVESPVEPTVILQVNENPLEVHENTLE